VTACKYAGSDSPRIVTGRHDYGCEDETCAGCQPCTEYHCRVCGVAHDEHTCAGCLAEVRENLADITRMCDALPSEAVARGVEGEAFVLLGPVANPEARGHLEASVAAGRVPADYLGELVGENDPLWMAETWAMVYRDAFDHDEPVSAVDLAAELGYLARNLTYAATWPHVPFEDFAKAVRRCVGAMESVLHDSDRGERTNIDCLDCGSPLERKLGPKGFDDLATCLGCKRRFTGPEYLLAVKRTYIRNAEWLGDGDMTLRTGVKADTVRSWARSPKDGSEPLVRKALQDGRTVYCVADVERVAVEKGLAA
jgi:hypothetical protein